MHLVAGVGGPGVDRWPGEKIDSQTEKMAKVVDLYIEFIAYSMFF